MIKKFLILLITLLVVILALLIYQRTTHDFVPSSVPSDIAPDDLSLSDRPDEAGIIEAGPVGVGRVRGVRYVARDEQGRIMREFGFAERLSTKTDVFVVAGPWVKIYGDNRVIEITAPVGSIPLELEHGGQMPSSGFLEEGVRIEVYSTVPSSTAQADSQLSRRSEFVAEMDRVMFEREFAQLSSRGSVRISGEQFSASGRDLTIQYDQVNNRLQELILRRLEKMRMQPALSEKSGVSREQDAGGQKPRSVEEGTSETKKVDTYVMSLNNGVVITQGQEKITAEKIEILVDFASSMVQQDVSSGLTGAGGGAAETSQSQATPKTDSTPDDSNDSTDKPLDGETSIESREVEITCSGPLRIRVLDDVEPARQSNRLEITAFGKPTKLWRAGEVIGHADRILYDHREKTIKLRADTRRNVSLSMGDKQQLTASREVSFNQTKAVAKLLGPGLIKYVSEDSEAPVEIKYADEVEIQFSDLPKGGLDPVDFDWNMKSLTFTGGVTSVSEKGRFQADCGRVLFYQPLEGAQVSQEQDSKGGDSREQETQGQMIQVRGLAAMLLRSVELRGDVLISDPCSLFAGEFLSAQFDRDDQGLSQLSSVLAEGAGGKVRMVDKKGKYEITGDRIEGETRDGSITEDGLWEIQGTPAVVKLARQGRVEGDKIKLDLKTGYCTIPGKGGIRAVSTRNLAGDKLKEPLPIVVEWLDGAGYNMNSNEIVAKSVVAAMEQRKSDARIVSSLKCPVMTIVLEEGEKEKQSGRSVSEFVAEGPSAQLTREQYDPCSGEMLVRMVMETQQLNYQKDPNILIARGEGLLDVFDFNPSPSKTPEEKQESLDNILSGLLGRDGPSYTMVHFLEKMEFHLDTQKVIFRDGVALHRIPGVEPDSDQLAHFNVPGSFRLHCDEMEVVRAAESPKSEDKTEEAASDQMLNIGVPGHLMARGDVVFEIVRQDGGKHLCAGELLNFDQRTNTVTVRGSETKPVRFDQMQFLWFKYNLGTGDFTGKPFGQSVMTDIF